VAQSGIDWHCTQNWVIKENVITYALIDFGEFMQINVALSYLAYENCL